MICHMAAPFFPQRIPEGGKESVTVTSRDVSFIGEEFSDKPLLRHATMVLYIVASVKVSVVIEAILG